MKAVSVKVTVAVALLIGIIGAYYFWQSTQVSPPPEKAETAPLVPTPAPAQAPVSKIRHPIEKALPQEGPADTPPVSEAQSSPGLDESEGMIRSAVASLLADASLREMIALDGFIRRFVATIDNLPRGKLALRLSPIRSAKGPFLVERSGDDFSIAAANTSRYAPYVALAEALDPDKLVAAYKQLYPLFQRAYQDLGYPQGYFNDRLVAVIDHLIAAPETAGALRLVQPKVLYQFADPQLENLSAAQKMMIRMGNDNALRIKARLRLVRARLAGQVAIP